MSTTEEKEEPKKKLAYEKPMLRVVDLVAEEVLAIGCKMTVSGTAFGGSPCTLNFCSDAGS